MSLNKFIKAEELAKFKDELMNGLLNAIEEPLDAEGIAKHLKYNDKKTLQNNIKNIPHHKIGKRALFYKSEVNAALKAGLLKTGNSGEAA